MISSGPRQLEHAPHISLIPGAVSCSCTVLALNAVGEKLQRRFGRQAGRDERSAFPGHAGRSCRSLAGARSLASSTVPSDAAPRRGPDDVVPDRTGTLRAVDRLSAWSSTAGRTLGIVGESGPARAC